jgi:Flp pilus assembly pilin Flp
MSRAPLFRLRRNDRGVTVVEFALLSPVLALLMFGLVDVAQRIYLTSVAQGTLFRAARRATIGDQTTTQIDNFVKAELKDFSKNATVTITKKSYSAFTGVSTLEKITSDTAPVGTYNKGTSALSPGDCYEDTNNNWKRDEKGKSGLGQSDDVIYYEVKVDFPRVIPLAGFMGLSNAVTVQVNTVLRNQPYGAQIPETPSVRCYEQ